MKFHYLYDQLGMQKIDILVRPDRPRQKIVLHMYWKKLYNNFVLQTLKIMSSLTKQKVKFSIFYSRMSLYDQMAKLQVGIAVNLLYMMLVLWDMVCINVFRSIFLGPMFSVIL
jgi:hypothetical protein